MKERYLLNVKAEVTPSFQRVQRSRRVWNYVQWSHEFRLLRQQRAADMMWRAAWNIKNALHVRLRFRQTEKHHMRLFVPKRFQPFIYTFVLWCQLARKLFFLFKAAVVLQKVFFFNAFVKIVTLSWHYNIRLGLDYLSEKHTTI